MTIGALYPLTNEIDLNINALFNLMNHKTQLELSPAKSEIKHKISSSLNTLFRRVSSYNEKLFHITC